MHSKDERTTINDADRMIAGGILNCSFLDSLRSSFPSNVGVPSHVLSFVRDVRGAGCVHSGMTEGDGKISFSWLGLTSCICIIRAITNYGALMLVRGGAELWLVGWMRGCHRSVR